MTGSAILDFDAVALFEALDAQRVERCLSWKGVAGLDEHRHAEALTWAQAAKVLCCTSNQLTELRTLRYATNMTLAMRIAQWVDEPAATFIRAAKW